MEKQVKLDLVVRAIEEAKEITPKGQQVTVYLPNVLKHRQFHLQELKDILKILQDDENIITLMRFPHHLLTLPPGYEYRDMLTGEKSSPATEYFTIKVNQKFDEWCANYWKMTHQQQEQVPYKAELPIQLFDNMKLYPSIVEASRSCFIAGNYREAILNAFIGLIDHIKELTGLDLDGDDLMNKVFSLAYDKERRNITKYPIIRINDLKNSNDRNEQQGFMFLCKGAAGGIRNPKAHKIIPQSNPLHTLEYLAFASLLMRRIDEGKVVKPKPPRERWNLEKFLIDAEKRCMLEKVKIMRELIDFTTSHSDAGILWGTGAKFGSFVFQKLINNAAVSIFQVYTDGTFFLYFRPLKNRGVNIDVLNAFRLNLNKIPSVKIRENVIIEKDKYGSLGLNNLINPENLKLFQDAVIALCQQLESNKEQA